MAKAGEETIDEVLSKIAAEKKLAEEVKVVPGTKPTPRSYFSMTAKEPDEIYIFGGEYLDGKRTTMFDNLYIFNTKENTWSEVQSSTKPAPRSSHQTILVNLPNQSPTLYLFGGEFVSKSQTSFKHFNDLWAFNTKNKKWRQIKVATGPTGRSGFRLAPWKQGFVLFGGFFDNSISTVYYNDLWYFNCANETWTKIQLPESPKILPRSNFIFSTSLDNKFIFIQGGFSRISDPKNKSLEPEPKVHIDSIQISFSDDGNIVVAVNKISGAKPSPPRTGLSFVKVSKSNNQLLVFGGVHDEYEDDDVYSTYSGEMLTLDPASSKWYKFNFQQEQNDGLEAMETDDAVPCPRSHAGLAVIKNTLFLYGGRSERGSKTITHDDMFSLDVTKPTKWNLLDVGTKEQDWSTDSEDSSEEIDAPVPEDGQDFPTYFANNKDFWMDIAKEEKVKGSVENFAQSLARQFYRDLRG